MREKIIVTLTTIGQPYWNMAKVFLHTLALHDPNTVVRMCVVNGSSKEAEKLKQYNPMVEIQPILADESTYIGIMKHRMPVVLSALREGFDKVAFMDHDIIVRDSLSKMWNMVKPGVLCVRYRPDWGGPKKYFQAGVHILGNSPEIEDYYSKVIDRSERWNDKYETQKNLYLVWSELRDLIQLVDLPPSYNDYEFAKNSVVWHCKGSHFRDKRFQKEFKKVLVEAREAKKKCCNNSA